MAGYRNLINVDDFQLLEITWELAQSEQISNVTYYSSKWYVAREQWRVNSVGLKTSYKWYEDWPTFSEN